MAKKLNVKIKPIGLLDIIAFTNLVPNRKKKFSEAKDTPIETMPPVNKLAKILHPKNQELVIKEIKKEAGKVKTFILGKADNSLPAYFRAGQYISIRAKVNDSIITRPYSLSSSPKQALEGNYNITIKEPEEGYFSKYVMKNWKVGTIINTSAPEGTFYYEPIRDAKTIIGICGGSGVTPFFSLSKAIADGTEACSLILLYGSVKESEIVFHNDFIELEKAAKGKIKVINVLSNEKKEGYEEGFITAALIKKYAPKDEPYSIFICGPQIMYNFVAKEISTLNILPKFIRRELFGEHKMIDKVKGYPKDALGKIFKLTVKSCSDIKVIEAKAEESVLVAIERAGIASPSKCRSGVCGFCRSKIISGNVFIPEDIDGRRAADRKFGFIHPCATYPISDLTIEITPVPSGK